MLFSTFISVALFLSLIALSAYYEQYSNEKLFADQEAEIINLVESIRQEVDAQSLTYRETKKKDFDDDYPYNIEFYKSNDDELSKYNYYKNRNYIFTISYADIDGVIVFESEEAEFASETHHIIAGIISLILFFALSIRIIYTLVSYIKIIESGVKKLSDNEDANSEKRYTIPIVGHNELARLANSVNEIKQELHEKTLKEKADEQHQRMLITNMSHDLRTPLTSVIGYLDLAKSELSQISESLGNEKINKAQSYLEVAEKSSHRLKKLVADLFLYSKILSNDMQIHTQEIDINVLLKQIIELKPKEILFSSKFKEIHLPLDVEIFHRIIDNLLDNAIKYGTQEKEITLTSYKKANKVIIEITNYTNDDLSKKIKLLTKRLYTADENRKDASSGLGLSIVSELCKKIHADFTLDFVEGRVIACVSV